MLKIFVLQKTIFMCVFVNYSYLIISVSSNNFQNQFQVAYSQHHQTPLLNDSHYTSKNEISNTLMEQFKEIVFNQTALF